jgi:carbamoyl-phosphate synthase large subunit
LKILITGVGGPTPRSFAIALKKYSRFKDCEVIGTDINPLAYGLYQEELFDHSYVIPRADDAAYWSRIERIIEKHGIEYAVVLPEFEVLEWSRRKEKGDLPCKVLLPDLKLAEMLVDKAKMTELLAPYDLVPKSATFSSDESDLSRVFEHLGNEFWVRGTSGTSGLGSLKVDSPESLKNWIQINPDVKEFIGSTYLPSRNLACKLLYFNGKLLRSACAERVNYIMAKVAPSGITGNTSFGRLLNEPKLTETAVKAMDLLFSNTKAKKHGFFTVDFKESADGKAYITEVNVRHVAFTQCFAAGGANFAEDTMRLLSGDKSFEHDYKYYEFEDGLIFLRDVDEKPIIMKEQDLKSLT